MMTSPASDNRCVFTGRIADARHHVTGRGADGLYLDPALVVPLARRQHVVEHSGWRVVGIGEGVDVRTDVLRLRRAAFHLVRLGEHHGAGVAMMPATFLRELGLMLHRIAADLGKVEHR